MLKWSAQQIREWFAEGIAAERVESERRIAERVAHRSDEPVLVCSETLQESIDRYIGVI